MILFIIWFILINPIDLFRFKEEYFGHSLRIYLRRIHNTSCDCLNTCFVTPSCKAVTVHRISEKFECLYSIPKVPLILIHDEQSITYCKEECLIEERYSESKNPTSSITKTSEVKSSTMETFTEGSTYESTSTAQKQTTTSSSDDSGKETLTDQSTTAGESSFSTERTSSVSTPEETKTTKTESFANGWTQENSYPTQNPSSSRSEQTDGRSNTNTKENTDDENNTEENTEGKTTTAKSDGINIVLK